MRGGGAAAARQLARKILDHVGGVRDPQSLGHIVVIVFACEEHAAQQDAAEQRCRTATKQRTLL
jgi:hypothetical protein